MSKTFEYGYDFSDQATMCMFDKSTYNKIHSEFESPIKQLDSMLEGNTIRMHEIQILINQTEQYNNYNIDKLNLNPYYYRKLHLQNQLERENKELRLSIISRQKEFHDLIVRKYNNQTVPNWFNPQNITVKDDLIVSSGLDIIGTQITNRTANRWAYFHIGESSQSASMDQQTLKIPITAYPVSQIGSLTSVGDQIRFFGSIPSTLRSVDIKEIGLSTKLTGGFLLNRSVYPETDPLKHIKDKTYPVATIVIYMTSDQSFSTKA